MSKHIDSETATCVMCQVVETTNSAKIPKL